MLYSLLLHLIKIQDMRFSVVIEHGGTGSSAAAPIAKKVIRKVLDRHKLRTKYQSDLFKEV